jgi:hypothetical protein
MSSRKIIDLQTHPERFVTMSDLADYWRVTRKQIVKQIEAGTLRTVRLAPRMVRVRTRDAIGFEEMAAMAPSERKTLSRRHNGMIATTERSISPGDADGERRTHRP